jgi:hypothetical protein
MFRNSSITDFSKYVLNFSKVGSATGIFYGSKATHIGNIDCSGVRHNMIGDIFRNCADLKTIDSFTFPNTRQPNNTKYGSNFSGCVSLENLRIKGTIYFDVSWVDSPLTLESAISVINALENYAGTDKEFTYTLTFSPTTWGYLDAEGETASPNGNSWREYINDLGWNAS